VCAGNDIGGDHAPDRLQFGHNAATEREQRQRASRRPAEHLLDDRGCRNLLGLAEPLAYRIGSGSAPTVWKATRIGR
jgi:hypothetical protein